jgi:hypothetical protein
MCNIDVKSLLAEKIGKTCCLMLAMVFCQLANQPASAATVLNENLDTLYDKVLQDPGNLEYLQRYAQEAIIVGDFEAAISALEGMLVVAGNQPRILYELGTLYQRLGAHKVASSYLARARVLAASDPELMALIASYLDASDASDGEISKHNTTGIILSGLRHQSNPMASPESSEILLGGRLISLPELSTKKDDASLYLFGLLEHRYNWSSTTTVEGELIGYASKYDKKDQLDFGFVEFTLGPKTSLASTGDRWSLKPYLLARHTEVNGNNFENTWGVGFETTYVPGTSSFFQAAIQKRKLNFHDYTGSGIAPLMGGDEHRVSVLWGKEIKQGHMLNLSIFARHVDAEVDYFNFDKIDLSARYSIRFDNIFFKNNIKQSISFSATRSSTDYDAPQFAIDPINKRDDNQWRLGISSVIPFSNRWELYLGVEHSTRNSNIVNYDSENELISVALQMAL